MNEEMYRVTKQYQGVMIEATVTISMRVQAYGHSEAIDIAEKTAASRILKNITEWMLMKVVVQNEEQVETGDISWKSG